VLPGPELARPEAPHRTGKDARHHAGGVGPSSGLPRGVPPPRVPKSRRRHGLASGQSASTDGVGSEDSELAQGKRVSGRGVEQNRKPSRRTHLTLGELAGISGRSAKYLRALIRRGTLAAEKVAGKYYFRRRTLD